MADRTLLAEPRRVHLIGVGGAGIGAMAAVLVAMGHQVTGSDITASPMLERLAGLGVAVRVGHAAANVGGAELVAASTAIGGDNPEVLEAQRRGLPVLRRAELLAAMCATRRTLAVAGTHGKTTTSSMLALILVEAGWAPSYLIGGDIVGLGSGARWDPDGEWLVVEADESDGTFLALDTAGVIVTSVEADHLDFYGTEEALHAAFGTFLAAANGPRVVCADDPTAMRVATAAGVEFLSYGTATGASVLIDSIEVSSSGSRFSLRDGTTGTSFGPFELAAPGAHFVRNACGAFTLARALGVDAATARSGLARYRGVARRFERRGEAGGAVLVDDYGHLPAEVAATLATARQGGWKRVVVVFQPHRYSRTESLWPQFADAFVDADVVVITDVYAAGEAVRSGVTGELIASAVARAHPGADVRYEPDRGRLAETVGAILQPGDVCVTLGAGDITHLPTELAARWSR